MHGKLGWGVGLLVVVACASQACKDDEASAGPGAPAASDAGADAAASSGLDGSAATDGGAGEGGACAGADAQTVDGLTKMLGGWRWSKDIVGGSDVDLPACDQRIGYYVGPDIAQPGYAQCAVARGEVIPLRGGNYASTATGCIDLTCSKMGLLMVGAKAAAVHALGGDGKPTGQAVFFFQIVPNAVGGIDLVQSNSGTTLENAKRMTRADGVPTCK